MLRSNYAPQSHDLMNRLLEKEMFWEISRSGASFGYKRFFLGQFLVKSVGMQWIAANLKHQKLEPTEGPHRSRSS
ncbi:hypothetical protein Tco_1089106 [Tanacetum coccineum]